MIRSRTPAFRRRQVSWTIRQRLTLTVDMLDAYAPTGDAPIRSLLRACELPSSRLAGRHADLDLVECERQAAQILEQPTARRSGIGGGLSPPLVVGTPRIGLTQEEDRPHGVDQPPVVDRVALLLAAIIARLLSWILGAPDAPCSAIMPTRGEAGAWADAGVGGADACGGFGTGTTRALASVSVTPRRFASAVTDRVGASPSARRVVWRTPRKT